MSAQPWPLWPKLLIVLSPLFIILACVMYQRYAFEAAKTTNVEYGAVALRFRPGDGPNVVWRFDDEKRAVTCYVITNTSVSCVPWNFGGASIDYRDEVKTP